MTCFIEFRSLPSGGRALVEVSTIAVVIEGPDGVGCVLSLVDGDAMHVSESYETVRERIIKVGRQLAQMNAASSN